MVTMVDQIYDRGYQAARIHLNASLAGFVARAAKSALDAFAVLNRIEYLAPWASEKPKARCR
jgi:hypothetical protein